jgi:prepilin-type N-terminal cleavage/methylation domain-containing protein
VKRSSARAFSLVEVMVAMGLGGVIVASAVTTFKFALDEQGVAKREWQAFTIAQQRMELLSALPTTHPLLANNVAGANAGTAADATCDDIALGPQHLQVDGLGNPKPGGLFDVCYRVTDGNPIGSKKNVRVVITYEYEGKRHVTLQTIR